MSFSHMPVSQSCPVNPSTHWHLFRPTHNPPFLHDGAHFKGSEEGNTNTRKKSVSVRKVVCSWVRFVFVCSPIWQRAPSQPSKQLQVLMSTHLPPLTHGGEQRATHTHKHKCEILVHSNNVTHTHILTYETLRSGVVWGTLTGVWSDTPSTITTRQITHRWDKHTSTSNQCHTVCVCVYMYGLVTCVAAVTCPAWGTQADVPPHTWTSMSAGWRTHGCITHKHNIIKLNEDTAGTSIGLMSSVSTQNWTLNIRTQWRSWYYKIQIIRFESQKKSSRNKHVTLPEHPGPG